MSQSAALIKALKKCLKMNDVKYVDVAAALDLSEASVKRLFSEESFSLKRLDQICEMMGMTITDLVEMVRQSETLQSLTLAQEQEIIDDLRLLVVANSAVNRWSYEDILATYDLTEPELIQCLAKLDRLKLIELLPGNRIKLLIGRNFSWQKNGPIQKFFEDILVNEFFNYRFDEPGDKRKFLVGMLSKASNLSFQRKLDQLGEEFHRLHIEDEKLPVEQRFGTSVVIGMRRWEPLSFEKLRRKKDLREF